MHGVLHGFQSASPGGEGDVIHNRKVTWALDGPVLSFHHLTYILQGSLSGWYVCEWRRGRPWKQGTHWPVLSFRHEGWRPGTSEGKEEGKSGQTLDIFWGGSCQESLGNWMPGEAKRGVRGNCKIRGLSNVCLFVCLTFYLLGAPGWLSAPTSLFLSFLPFLKSALPFFIASSCLLIFQVSPLLFWNITTSHMLFKQFDWHPPLANPRAGVGVPSLWIWVGACHYSNQ